MGDDVLRAANGRPLTRAEIDTVVRESIRLNADLDALGPDGVQGLLDRTPYRPRQVRRPARTKGIVWSLVGLVATALVLALFVADPLGLRLVTTAATSPHEYSDGRYAFMRMQPDGRDLPVGYNPCHRIPVSINYAGATPDIRERVEEAIREINAASGLHLAYTGASLQRRGYAVQSGGLIISFASAGTDSYLGGGVIGVGGSLSYPTAVSGSTTYLVGGGVTLDQDDFDRAPHSIQRAVLLHELGHAIGLAHVKGSTEIMNPSVGRATHYQHGDLTALAILGNLPCR